MNRPADTPAARHGARAMTIQVPAHQFEALCQLVDAFWRSQHDAAAAPADRVAASVQTADALTGLVAFAMTGRGQRARVVARVLTSLFGAERCLVDLKTLARLEGEQLAQVLQLLSREGGTSREELQAHSEQLRTLRSWVESDDA